MREVVAKAPAGDNVWANAPAGAGLCFRNKKPAETDRVFSIYLKTKPMIWLKFLYSLQTYRQVLEMKEFAKFTLVWAVEFSK